MVLDVVLVLECVIISSSSSLEDSLSNMCSSLLVVLESCVAISVFDDGLITFPFYSYYSGSTDSPFLLMKNSLAWAILTSESSIVVVYLTL